MPDGDAPSQRQEQCPVCGVPRLFARYDLYQRYRCQTCGQESAEPPRLVDGKLEKAAGCFGISLGLLSMTPAAGCFAAMVVVAVKAFLVAVLLTFVVAGLALVYFLWQWFT